MGFVAADAADPEYGYTATLLLALNDELGYHVREVRTVPGGFEVPDPVSVQFEPASVPSMPIVTESPEPKIPPPGWDDPLPEVQVTYDPSDGKFYAPATALIEDAEATEAAVSEDEPETDRQVIRAWAKDAGMDVADKGRLPQAVIEAYHLAQVE